MLKIQARSNIVDPIDYNPVVMIFTTSRFLFEGGEEWGIFLAGTSAELCRWRKHIGRHCGPNSVDGEDTLAGALAEFCRWRMHMALWADGEAVH